MVGMIDLRDRAFSSSREQKNDAPRQPSFCQYLQRVYATVDLPVPAIPLSQKMGELLSLFAHCFRRDISATRVFSVQARLAGARVPASALNSAFGANQGDSIV
jgi:hypothetical protein